MPLENNGIGPDGLIEATLYEVSSGKILSPIAVTRIEMLDLQDFGDQSYVLGTWDPEGFRIVAGVAERIPHPSNDA